jgi:SpoVK/Ycf46/Vps4 family AAA+-type ATPase
MTPKSDWRRDNARWLQLALQRLRLRMHRRALWLQRAPDQPRSADWLLAEDAEGEHQFFAGHAGVQAIDAAIQAIDAQLSAAEQPMRESGRPPALLALAAQADLSTFETDLLLLAAAPSLVSAFGRACAELHDDIRRDRPTLHLALAIFGDEAVSRLLAADALMPTGALRALSLVELGGADGDPLVSRSLSVDERMIDYLRGVNRCDERLLPLLRTVPPALSSAAIDEHGHQVAVLVAQQSGGRPINLVGTVEGGANDVAQRACEELGLRLYQLDVPRLTAGQAADEPRLIALAGREARLGGLALSVNTGDVERGTAAAFAIDRLIRQFHGVLFVVSAERWSSGEGLQVVPVARPTRIEQRELWRTALGPHVHSVNGGLAAIVEQFDFGPPAIADAVASAASRSLEGITDKSLWRACRERSGAELDDLAHRIVPSFGWDDIVVGDDVRAQLVELCSQVEHRARVYEGWGFGARLGRGRGISALFSGASGTGKTMAAEILAGHLELDLYRIDLAGVVSKYVGETEKNLRRIFDAAERSGAILFFDEADALFGARTEVRDSHDRYANVEINYLLQRMEGYTGLAILATNRRAALDSAFLRRLRFVIDFPFPSTADRRRIWERVFPPEAAVDGVEFGVLSRLELSGGNIKSMAINAAFLAAGDHAAIGMAHLARAAAREHAKLSKPMTVPELNAYAGGGRS